MPGLSRLATLPKRQKTAENRRKRLKWRPGAAQQLAAGPLGRLPCPALSVEGRPTTPDTAAEAAKPA
jgi:hypothetical protein